MKKKNYLLYVAYASKIYLKVNIKISPSHISKSANDEILGTNQVRQYQISNEELLKVKTNQIITKLLNEK